jgi:hypothetical protein
MLKIWDQDPEGEPYKVTQSTSVYGCCMGLCSDILECRYCLCEPCKQTGEEADREQSRRVTKAVKQGVEEAIHRI